MPNAIHFEGENAVYKAPNCNDLPAMRLYVPFGNGRVEQVTACYQFSQEELQEIDRNGGKFFVSTLYGWPPLSISITKPEPEPISFDELCSWLHEHENDVRVVPKDDRVLVIFKEEHFNLSVDEWTDLSARYGELYLNK